MMANPYNTDLIYELFGEISSLSCRFQEILIMVMITTVVVLSVLTVLYTSIERAFNHDGHLLHSSTLCRANGQGLAGLSMERASDRARFDRTDPAQFNITECLGPGSPGSTRW